MQSSCFVLMPFSDPFNEYYRDVLAPAIQKVGLKPVRADDIYGTGPIIDDIVDGIKNSVAVVADVMGRNPNVNYELGLAHAFGRPVVIISQSMDDIPFDYRYVRAIIYEIQKHDWAERLQKAIKNSLENCRPLRLGSYERAGAASPEAGEVLMVPVPVPIKLQAARPTESESQAASLMQSKLLTKLHHVSIPVRDLEVSLSFYREALDLEILPSRPHFPFPGEWLALPSGQEIHLVHNPDGTFRNSRDINPRDTHFAIQVKDWRRANLLLLERNIKSLLDPYQLCLLQTYILDPDDHVIEINALGLPEL